MMVNQSPPQPSSWRPGTPNRRAAQLLIGSAALLGVACGGTLENEEHVNSSEVVAPASGCTSPVFEIADPVVARAYPGGTAALRDLGTSGSLEFWFNAASYVPNSKSLIDYWEPTGDYLWVKTHGGGLQAKMARGRGEVAMATVSPPAGAWVHLVVAWTASDRLRIYVNGTESDSAPSSDATWTPSSGEMFIDKWNVLGIQVENLKLFDVELDAAQIDARFRAGRGQTCGASSGGGDVFRIKSVFGGRYHQTTGVASGSLVQTVGLNTNEDAQKWIFEPVSANRFRIKSAAGTDLYLAPLTNAAWQRLAVDASNASAHEWVLEPASGNTQRIRYAASSNPSLYMKTDYDRDNAHVVVAPLNNGWTAQQFVLEPVTAQGGGTTGPTGPVCGNATCESGETCGSCAADCGPCGGSGLPAADYFVSASRGNDNNSGRSKGSPFKTIRKAIQRVGAGEIVEVADGTYYETLTISNKGTSANRPLWIRAENPGKAVVSACLPGPREGRTTWRNDGGGTYSIPHRNDVLMGHHVNDRTFLARFKTRADLQSGNLSIPGGRVRVPRYGMAQQNGRVWLRLKDSGNPTGQNVLIPKAWTTTLVQVRNTPYLIIDGFRLECSGNVKAMTVDGGSHHATIRNIDYDMSRQGASLSNDSIVEWTDYGYSNFKEWADDVRIANGSPPSGPHVYDYVKRYNSNGRGNAYYEGGMSESNSSTSPQQRIQLRYNFYHDNFDGERFGAFENSDLHHNVFKYCFDNSYEAEYWRAANYRGRNLRIHQNLFLDGMGNHMSHQLVNNTMTGPHYVYRNVIYDSESVFGRGSSIIKNKGLANTGLNVYVYHNVLQSLNGLDGDSLEIKWGSTDQLFWNSNVAGSQNLHLRNNAIIFEGGSSGHSKSPAGDSDYNVMVDPARNERDIYGRNGLRRTSVSQLGFENYGSNFTPNANSVLRGAAGPIPSGWRAPDVAGMSRRDVGAFQVANPQPANWPRRYSRTQKHFTRTVPDRWR